MSRQQLTVLAVGSRSTAAAVEAGLKQTVSGEVRFDRLSRALFSTDASVYQVVPLGVVLPKTEADILATVRTCSRHGVPLTARGGGTSQAGQCIGPGVVLDCSKHLNRVLEINAAERWARVQPGVVLDDLNEQLKPHGLQFAPDISTSNRATVGGMVANNSSGTRSLLHGKTIDHVLGIKAVLADGSVIDAAPLDTTAVDAKCSQDDLEGRCYLTVRRLAREHADEVERRFPKILRRVGGYNLDRFSGGDFNLAHLLIGSEGTLAVTLEVTVRLVELPRAKALLVIQFDDLLDALAATPTVLEHKPVAVEVMDRYILDSTKLNAEAARLRTFLHDDPAAILIVEFYADQADELPARLMALEDDLRRRGLGTHFILATDAYDQGRVWKLRKLALGLSMAEKGDAKAISFVEDTAVAPERLRDYIAEFLDLLTRHDTRAGVYAHASVGCLHVRPVIDLKTEDGVRKFESIAEGVAELVLKYGGALSGEHGDGLVRSPFQEKMFGPVLYQAFREIKRTFDPQGILNPGKIVDAPPLTTNLRYGPAYVTPDVPTTFDFSADGGMVRAAELCAGVGECRKTRDGTMCPSYQATREETHSTRGRANVLRLAMTGQMDFKGLTDPAVKEVLDLCLECKACKTECPTNVDMARLKAEVFHQHHKKHGFPLRSQLFGGVWGLNRWAAWMPKAFNAWTRSRVGRFVHEKLFGIDSRRVPPSVVGGDRLLVECVEGLLIDAKDADVILLPDTFTRFYEPQVGVAAFRVLRKVGCRVRLGGFEGDPVPWELNKGPTELRCCGRPLISNGLLDQAVRDARHNVGRLFPWVVEGKSFVTCEPSCVLTIKDDYPALLRGDDRRKAEAVAAACRTFEEVVDEKLAARKETPWKPHKGRLLVQGHCHQRSLVGMGPTLRLLRSVPGAKVIDLDAGCCGLAGSFGYEKEHYEVSRLVGEQRLFPAIRAATADDVVVAAGFSCRQQFQHFLGRDAEHPAEVLLKSLG